VGAALPTGQECATLVRATTSAENKGVNKAANATVGNPIAGATGTQARVDGNFTGTTQQILRWAACKWGVDEDLVFAQVAIESWWRQDTRGDFGTDPTRCPPGHGLGVDGTAGQCPESWGLLQIRYPYNVSAFPDALSSSAFNADYAYANWRACYQGEWTWLNTVERGSDYAAGDAYGCMGVWFSGRWHTSAANEYIARVQGYLNQRIWETPNFAQP
jgi:autotransporter family porin